MFATVHDLKDFYASSHGRLVRRLVLDRVREIWPDLHAMRVLGQGYAVPYLRGLMEATERTVALMPPDAGVHFWPEREKGLVALAEESDWPVETESIDRLLLVHSLENAHAPDAMLREAWRVLKSNGRLMLVVPNRLGLWARAEWTPFGHGRPYTAGQIGDYLRAAAFVHERTERALFMPPFKSFLVLRGAYALEAIGRALAPALAGIYVVEASKQVYAGARVRVDKVERRALVAGALPA